MTSSLPLPIARLLHVASLAGDAKSRYDKVFEAWEASIKISVAAEPPTDTSPLARGSLGEWVNAHPRRTAALIEPALLDTLRLLTEVGRGQARNVRRTSGSELLAAVPAYRNKTSGHGASNPDPSFYGRVTEVLRAGLLAAWRSEVFWPQSSRLVLVDRVEVGVDGRHCARGQVMMGETPRPMDLDVGADALPRRLYIAGRDGGLTALYPWLVPGGTILDPRVLFFNGFASTALFLDYLGGENTDAKRLAAAFPAIDNDTRATFAGKKASPRTSEVLRGTWRVEAVLVQAARLSRYFVRHVELDTATGVAVVLAPTGDERHELVRTAALWAKAERAHVARIEDLGKLPDGSLLVVAERSALETLEQALERRVRLTVAETVRLGEQVATALGAAHTCGVVHGALTPASIWLAEVGGIPSARVSDFALPWGTLGGEDGLAYVAPEVLRGEPPTARSDVYSLAAVLYHALSGERPHADASGPELRARVLSDRPPADVTESDTALAPEIDAALRLGLCPDPARRIGTPAALAAELETASQASRWSRAPRPTALRGATVTFSTSQGGDALTQALWIGTRVEPDRLSFSGREAHGTHDTSPAYTLRIDRADHALAVGRAEGLNDLVIAHDGVSRQALLVSRRDGRVYVRRHPKCSVRVQVGQLSLDRGAEAPMHHGHAVLVGPIWGVLHDGRYGDAPIHGSMVDPGTGLLGKDGIVWEAVRRVRGTGGALLLVVTTPADSARGEELDLAAWALHRSFPSTPVARLNDAIAALVVEPVVINDLVEVVRRAVPRGTCLGCQRLDAPAEQVAGAIEGAVAVCRRLASAGPIASVVDLAEHRAATCSEAEFVERATALAAAGGTAGLVALERVRQLDDLTPLLRQGVEGELLQLTLAALPSAPIVAELGGGVLAIAAPGSTSELGRQLARDWSALGPVRSGPVEVERSLTWMEIPSGQIAEVARLARELSSSASVTEGIEGLPLPLAIPLRSALVAPPGERQLEGLVTAVDATWQFLGTLVGTLARIERHTLPELDCEGEPERAWSALTQAAVSTTRDDSPPFGPLVQALFRRDGKPSRGLQRATEVAEQYLNRRARRQREAAEDLAGVVRALAGALWPLRSWALVSVEHVEPTTAFGDRTRIEYTDFTGTFPRGTPRHVTLVGDVRLGPFVYLARPSEGAWIPFEPMVRRRRSPRANTTELFWAERPVLVPGIHRYVSVVTAEILEVEVSGQDLPEPD